MGKARGLVRGVRPALALTGPRLVAVAAMVVGTLVAAPSPGAGGSSAAPPAVGAAIRTTLLPGLPPPEGPGTEPGLIPGPARPFDIDDSGRIAGEAWTAAGTGHAVVWDGDVLTELPSTTEVAWSALASGVAGDTVAGTERGTRAGSRAVLWEGGERLVPAAEGHSSDTWGINARGQVLYAATAPATGGRSAVVWDRGRVTAAPLVGGAPLFGLDIGDGGLVAGYLNGASGAAAPYTWRPGRAPRPLRLPPGAASAVPWAVGAGGDVVGTANVPGGTGGTGGDGSRTQAVRWRDGRVQVLPALGGPSSAVAGEYLPVTGGRPVNRWGDVVGTGDTSAGEAHAVLWRHGRATDLGTLGGPTSEAVAINDWGQVVGMSDTADGERHAFLWQAGRMVDLTALLPVDGAVTEVTDVNNRGQVIGYEARNPYQPLAVRWDVPVLWGFLPN